MQLRDRRRCQAGTIARWTSRFSVRSPFSRPWYSRP